MEGGINPRGPLSASTEIDELGNVERAHLDVLRDRGGIMTSLQEPRISSGGSGREENFNPSIFRSIREWGHVKRCEENRELH